MARIVAQSRKILIGILGGLVTIIGLLLIPYPGPGWLIVFAGLAILSTEFDFAKRTLKFVRGKYDAWVAWNKKQPWPVRIISLALTGLVVLVTVWLVNGFGIIAGFLDINQQWFISPLFR